MAKPHHPGGNAGKGRVKGVPNKATRELKDMARDYTADALKTLAQIMLTSESDQARVAAANALLDRGYGKPQQSIEARLDGSITLHERRQQISQAIATLFDVTELVNTDVNRPMSTELRSRRRRLATIATA